MAKRPGLDGRHRDRNGEIHHKMGNAKVGTLRKTYGDDFAKGRRGDMKLENLLKETGAKSLTDLRNNYAHGDTRVGLKGYGSLKEFTVRRGIDVSKPIYEQASKRAKKESRR
jgi:hypothetical protein